MTGIRELFAELEEEAHYHCEAQLELFVWAYREQRREACNGYQRKYALKERSDPAKLEARRARQRAYRARLRARRAA